MVNCNKLLRNIAQAVATWCAIAPPRGATPRRRSGAEARRTPCPKGGSQEELPHVRGQGQQPRAQDCDGAGTAKRSYPASEVREGGDERSYPVSKVRSSGWEELPHAPKPEARGSGQEELPHAPTPRPGAVARRSNPRPRPGAATRGVTPRPRSGAMVGRRYPMPQAQGQGPRAGGATTRP